MFLNEEQRLALFEQEQALAHYVAHRYAAPEDKEDVHQEALLALWIATGTYNPDRSDIFSTYAFYVISDYVRRYKKSNRSQIYYPRSKKVDMFPVDLEDTDIPNPIKDIEDTMDHENTIRDLPGHLSLVVRLKLKGYKVAEICSKLNLHETTVLDYLKQIRQHLQ